MGTMPEVTQGWSWALQRKKKTPYTGGFGSFVGEPSQTLDGRDEQDT